MVKLRGDYRIERIDADGQDIYFVEMRVPVSLLDVIGGIDLLFKEAKRELVMEHSYTKETSEDPS